MLRYTIAIAALLAALPAVHAADAPLIPIASFVQPDEFSSPRLSPDGKHIAITARVPKDGKHIPTIMVYSLPAMKQISATQLIAREVPLTYTWVSNTRLVVEKGRMVGSKQRPFATGEVVAMDLDGTKQEYLYGWNFERMSRHGDRYTDNDGWGYVTDVPGSLNGRFFMTTTTVDDVSMLYDVNSFRGERSLLASITNPNISYVLQNDGKPRFATGNDRFKYEPILYKLDDKSGKWNVVEGEASRGGLNPFAFSADNTEFMAFVSPDGGPRALVRENLATGQRVPVMKDPVGSISHLQWGSKKYFPFAAATDVGIPEFKYIDPSSDDAKLHKKLTDKFPGHVISFINYTEDGSRLLFLAYNDREPGAYFLYDTASGKANPLFMSRELIDPAEMAERRPISYKARDGLVLHGYLTVPNKSTGKAPPLVLLPHGGPHGVSDDWSFDQDAQFLASRGYAVLQVNYRGSDGRGTSFKRAGFRNWGTKIQDDLIDGVKWTVAQGLADGNRVCAYGASFGAYSAMMVAIRAPEMFKCAVGYAGLYDLNLMVADSDGKGSSKSNTFLEYVGNDPAELSRNSPTALAAQLKVPVMIIHGKDDKVTPLEQAEAMRLALLRVNRPPEYLAVPDEGHGFYATKNATMFYEKLETFLGQHLK